MISKKTLDKFIEIIEQNKFSLYRTAYGFLKNQTDAEDAVADAIYKAYTHLDKLKDTRKMKSWLYRILMNQCKDMLSSDKSFDKIDENIQSCSGINLEEKIDLFYVIEQLDDSFQQVVILYYFNDLSVREIAAILKISVGTVKSRLSRARKKMKEYMK